MTYFSTDERLRDRLTDAGVRWYADNARAGTSNSAEVVATLTAGRAWAANQIAAALSDQIDPDAAAGQNVPYLMDIADDLAAYRVAGTGGREVQTTIKEAAQIAIAALRDAKDGHLVPGLILPQPANAYGMSRVVRVFGGGP